MMSAQAAHRQVLNIVAQTRHELDIANDFSPTPGGRYKIHGLYSGEEFRQDYLVDAFRDAKAKNYVLRVRIDGVKRSYLVSFLDESFAGLITEEGFSREDVKKHLEIVCNDPRFMKYKILAEKFIDDAK